jgi:ketosteroid isomerase-like protein
MADPKIIEQLNAKYKNYDEAYNNNDAAAMGAFFTEDGVLVTDRGPIYGREAIKKHFADVFQKFNFSNHIGKPDQYSPHIIGTAGNEIWATGEWSLTIKGQNFGPIEEKGYWTEIYVREGDAWKVRMQTWNVTPAPPAEKK